MIQVQKTWLVVGASRGIGLEFVRQLHAHGHNVVATQRSNTPALTELHGVHVLQCDIASETSIKDCVTAVAHAGHAVEVAIINAGILQYPNRATEMSFAAFAHHLNTNTVGPIIMAQHLLKLPTPVKTIVFISSDSASTTNFLDMEDGFAAYSASKAALNQALRHMSAELKRKQVQSSIIALHPGEVATDMANIELDWEVKGMISPNESVSGMLHVIETKSDADSGTFWTWKNEQYPW